MMLTLSLDADELPEALYLAFTSASQVVSDHPHAAPRALGWSEQDEPTRALWRETAKRLIALNTPT